MIHEVALAQVDGDLAIRRRLFEHLERGDHVFHSGRSGDGGGGGGGGDVEGGFGGGGGKSGLDGRRERDDGGGGGGVRRGARGWH